MRKTIKDLIQNKEAPIVFVTVSAEVKQQLYLCRYADNFLVDGQPIPKGTYLLANEETIRFLENYVAFTLVRQESITAFVLPFFKRDVGMLTIDNSADLVVTPRLTGCTFAAELHTTTPTLLHLNKTYQEVTEAGVSEYIDQEAIDHEIEACLPGKTCFTLTKDDYKLSDYHATTVMGFRQDNGLWEYYSQITVFNEQSDSYQIMPGKQSTVPAVSLSTMGMTLNASPNNMSSEDDTSSYGYSNRCTLF